MKSTAELILVLAFLVIASFAAGVTIERSSVRADGAQRIVFDPIGSDTLGWTCPSNTVAVMPLIPQGMLIGTVQPAPTWTDDKGVQHTGTSYVQFYSYDETISKPICIEK